MFPQVPQSFLGILTVPQIPHPIEHTPPLRTLQQYEKDPLVGQTGGRFLKPMGSTKENMKTPGLKNSHPHYS